MRETSIGCLLHVPIRAPGPKCRHVSRVGIELVTICVAAQCPAWSGLQTYFKSPQTLRVGRFVFSELVALRATWNSKGLSRPAPMSCIQGTVSHHEPWQETRQTGTTEGRQCHMLQRIQKWLPPEQEALPSWRAGNPRT